MGFMAGKFRSVTLLSKITPTLMAFRWIQQLKGEKNQLANDTKNFYKILISLR